MSTEGSFAPPAQDFWRKNAGVDLPNGTNDTTDFIWRSGAVAIGGVQGNVAVAKLDVAGGARTGVDGRAVGQPMYVTAVFMPSMPAFNTAGLPTPVAGAEFRASNQTVGVGLASGGLYSVGSSADVPLMLLQKGAGVQAKGWQAPNVLSYLDDNYGGAAAAVGTAFTERHLANGILMAQQHHAIVEALAPLRTRKQWEIVIAGAIAEAMRLDSQGLLIAPVVAPPAKAATDEVLYRDAVTGRITRGSATGQVKHSFAGTAVTDVNGDAVFAFGTVFPAIPVITVGIENNPLVNVTARITAKSTGGCTINAIQGASGPVVGATINIFATEAGRVVP